MGVQINIDNGVSTMVVGPMTALKELDMSDFLEVIPFISDSDTGHFSIEVFEEKDDRLVLVLAIEIHRMVSLDALVDLVKRNY